MSRQYPSAFDEPDESPGEIPTPPPVSAVVEPDVAEPDASNTSPSHESYGLASLVCHTAFLEQRLRGGDKSRIFNHSRGPILERTTIGVGLSFIVDRAKAEVPNKDLYIGADTDTELRTVAVKTIREDQNRQGQWREVLFEIRALLHKPLHYHPNIVRLLDIRWDASVDTGSPFPTLIQEYAEFGSMNNLQKSQPPLPFAIKQKLCYDVARGLSILHACGIVHGDLKHENVLIFANRYSQPPNQPYTAKLADFGGTIMDMGGDGMHRVRTHTFPHEAPEIHEKLSPDGAKKTDAFSYGMLIWRCMIDCKDVAAEVGFKLGQGGVPTEKQRETMSLLKISDGLLDAAIHNISVYFSSHGLSGGSFSIATSALMYTLRGDPSQRFLDRAQARLRGMKPVTAFHYVSLKDKANARIIEDEKNAIPGIMGMNIDKVGYALGQLGHDYDAQINLPGFRPDLPHPSSTGFLFEPLRLKWFLDWSQQAQIAREFEAAAKSIRTEAPAPNLVPSQAAFFLYQSYLCGFGVAVSPATACYWLHQAVKISEANKSSSYTDVYCKSWLSRSHSALGINNPESAQRQIDYLYWGVHQGFHHCYDDAQCLIDACADNAQKSIWKADMKSSVRDYRMGVSYTGQPLFLRDHMIGNWEARHVFDVGLLEEEIRRTLGVENDACLRENADDASIAGTESLSEGRYRFDRIYVNSTGHGLLHMTAALGRLGVLKHLHEKYLCDINMRNQSRGDTPLTCACRSANLDCVMYCLENGADPSGADTAEESPLHCISDFNEAEMDVVVTKLLEKGANIEKRSSALSHFLLDWEDNLRIPVSPLGRAVINQSLSAVKILLKHGADPTGESPKPSRSPIELAAVLTLPDILEELLESLDKRTQKGANTRVIDDCEMLEAARSKKITEYDPLSLQSRIIRCGVHYKAWLTRTLLILKARRGMVPAASSSAKEHTVGRHLFAEILHGNTDTVEALLDMGHPVEGSAGFRPIHAAIGENNTQLFHLLVERGSPLSFPEDTDSPLHRLAMRPKRTPRTLAIAEYLINQAGLPVDPVSEERPSPLLRAIHMGDYDLADLLVSASTAESLNTIHVVPPSTDSYSLLGVLLQSQTSTSLRAMKYLADLHKRDTPSTKIEPIAIQSTEGIGISIVHTLATIPFAKWNSHGQISASIVQYVLEMFPDSQSLGDLAVHPVAGTPLALSVMTGHHEVFTALLSSAHRSGWDQPVEIRNPLLDEAIQVNLVELSLKLAAGEVQRLEYIESVSADDISSLKRRVDIFTTLFYMREDSDNDPSGTEARATWNPAYFEAALSRITAKPRSNRRVEIIRTQDADEIVDLSVLTEEQPSKESEGDQMSHEECLQFFLKDFKKDTGIFGDPVLKRMNGLFNNQA